MSQNKSIRTSVIFVIVLGIAALISSIFYASSLLAIVGFCLVFWGALLLYIVPTKSNYLAIFLHASSEVANANIEKMLSAYGSHQHGIYLPAKWVPSMKNVDAIPVFVPKKLIEQNKLNEKDLLSIPGLYLTPPGAGLCRILETQVGNSFSNINVQQFLEIIPSLLTKITGFAEVAKAQISENTLTIELTKNMFDATCQATDEEPQTHKQVGCLLSSSLACAIAKVTNTPVMITSEVRNLQAKTTKIEYRVLA
ncbi:MAG: hypothetical protein EHM25_11105 [Nitrosopumilales archaeon]|nr:MAG: hypothetical protein EHM25_11105 [Nitrosopumilales archaeon]